MGAAYIVAVVMGVVLGILLLVVLNSLLKSYLAGAVYYAMDYSTGFLKMKEWMRRQHAQQVRSLNDESKVFQGPYSHFGLRVGVTESSGYEDSLTVSGTYRPTHTYVVGASGSGKSSLLMNLVIQDIGNDMGLALIDPHGDLVASILPHLGGRKAQTVILDLVDTEHILSYNPLQRRDGVSVAEQTGKLLLAFKRIWEDSWGPRMEDILRHTLSLLIEQEYTLAEFARVLNDADFRAMLLEGTELEQAKEFFEDRYNKWDLKTRIERTESSLNKISAFLADERIGLALSQARSSFSVRGIMDSGGILLVNLAKGHLAGNADLFGALLMADIETSFLSRKPEDRKPFALYVDEFQNIATESFETFLAEARKFGLCLTLAHQTTKQLDEKLLALILGNAQTQIYFRVSREDAERFSRESVNIVREIEKQNEEPLLQERKVKLSLQELWEVAYHKLARLPARSAYVMVKGSLDHPEEICTMDNPEPPKKAEAFQYDGFYAPSSALKERLSKRFRSINKEIEAYRKQDRTLVAPTPTKDEASKHPEPVVEAAVAASGPPDLSEL